MVRVHADGAERCFVSFGCDTVSIWMFRMEEPSAFHEVYKSFDLLSVLYAGKKCIALGIVGLIRFAKVTGYVAYSLRRLHRSFAFYITIRLFLSNARECLRTFLNNYTANRLGCCFRIR